MRSTMAKVVGWWWLLWGLAGCSPTGSGPDKLAEICDNGSDDDGNGAVDCADAACPPCAEVCLDGIDNDGDLAVDCADPDCDGDCPEVCDDTRDNDGDGATDCDDLDCVGSCPEVCDDRFDNDGDGDIDCQDADCDGPGCAEICDDTRDNDLDGAADCADPDCDGGCPEVCDDGRDNDGDRSIDCSDADCEGVCDEICGDGLDNDGDGLRDCEDDDCLSDCDSDGDGYFDAALGGDDCDDENRAVNPGATEVCNRIDDDCDDVPDEDDPSLDPSSMRLFRVDDDLDTYGDFFAEPELRCFGGPGYVDNNLDCDDADPVINPDGTEVCNGRDDDCDRLTDDADDSLDPSSVPGWYPDRDGDGWGRDDPAPIYRCAAVPGRAPNNIDCDDDNALLGPRTDWWPDLDGDGFGAGTPVGVVDCFPPGPGLAPVEIGEDCNDGDRVIFPGAPEVCEDGVDQDCDGRDAGCYLGPYTISDGPEWTTGPRTYSCRQACAEALGGVEDDYSCSSSPSFKDLQAHYDTNGVFTCDDYYPDDHRPCPFYDPGCQSAYVRDNCAGYINHCWGR